MTIEQKSAKVLEWLGMPDDERPEFISVYISVVDTAGHKGGVNSPLVRTRTRVGYCILKKHVRSMTL